MIRIEKEDLTLLCEERNMDGKKALVVKGFEGGSAVLDLSDCNIAEIDRKAFLSCKILKHLILPGTVKHLGEWSFSKCTNLERVEIAGEFRGNVFDRGVFDGCDALKEICFSDLCEDAGILAACNANRMPNDHLLRSAELGQQSWFDQWDLTLLSLLRADDAEGSSNVALCGEEDISYDGVGMVDGEMPGETEEFIRNAAKNKCLLTICRLKHDTFLGDKVREQLYVYIRERGFGQKKDSVWRTLKEECSEDMECWQMYLDIVQPDRGTLNRMIEDLSYAQIQAKAFLIDAAGDSEDEWGDLLL